MGEGSYVEVLVKLAPQIKEVLGEDYALTVSDTKNYLCYIPGVELKT